MNRIGAVIRYLIAHWRIIVIVIGVLIVVGSSIGTMSWIVGRQLDTKLDTKLSDINGNISSMSGKLDKLPGDVEAAKTSINETDKAVGLKAKDDGSGSKELDPAGCLATIKADATALAGRVTEIEKLGGHTETLEAVVFGTKKPDGTVEKAGLQADVEILMADKATRDDLAAKAEEARVAAAQKKEEQRLAWVAADNKKVKEELAKIRELDPTFEYNGKTDAEVDALLQDKQYGFEKAVHDKYIALTTPNPTDIIADVVRDVAAPIVANLATKDELADVDAKARAAMNAAWALSQKPKCFETSSSPRMKKEARELLAPFIGK